MLALLAFEVTIYRHQELYRLRHNKATPPTRTLFHGITRRHLDESVLSCLKYFLNYFFYKFGLEVRPSEFHPEKPPAADLPFLLLLLLLGRPASSWP